MKNKVQLITYIDRFGKSSISEFQTFFENNLKEIFSGGIHCLPFFYPIDGSDAGYDPIDHTVTDQRIGTWEDVGKLAQKYDIMADIIVNHISSSSKEFQDVKKNGRKSHYFDLFLTKEKVCSKTKDPNKALERLYKIAEDEPFTTYEIGEVEKEIFWTTFTSDQLDIDAFSPLGIEYHDRILNTFQANGIKSIRLDAVGHIIKKPNTSCYMIPETYSFIHDFTQKAKKKGIEVLVEVHSHYRQQIQISKKVDYVYDFALPPLVLFALASGSGKPLKEWLKISPKNCLTVLDTHDGIGVTDVARQGDELGLLNDEEVDFLIESIHKNSNETSREASGNSHSNLDIHQINCSFYEALGCNDESYLIARAIQFFCPGIPQVYYAGFLAAKNDMVLLKKTNVGRDVNRPYYSFEEIRKYLDQQVVKNLCKLIRFRNEEPSFNGVFMIQESSNNELKFRWQLDENWSELAVDLQRKKFLIRYGDEQGERSLLLD